MITKNKFNNLTGSNDELIKLNTKKQKNIFKDEFTSKYQDQLFWLFYLIKFGVIEYEQVGEHYFSVEKQLKIKNIESIRKLPQILKEKKLKRNQIESDLLNSKVIDINTLYALCLYNDVNIIYVKNNCYIELFSNQPGPISLIKSHGKKNYCKVDIEEKEIEEIRKKNFFIENNNKPIKAISNYKLGEVVEISKYFNINSTYESGKNKTKKDLYQEIQSFIQKN